MKLSDYLTTTNTRLTDFAKSIGWPASTVHDWKTGRRTPRAEAIAAIERQTTGAVRAEDFCPAEAA